jgi:hypothetical protein
MIEGDSGEYSCQMSETNENIEKARHFVIISVFERQAWQIEEEMREEEKGSEEIDFIDPVDVTNSKYNKSERKKMLNTSVAMISSNSNSHGGYPSIFIFPQIPCIVFIFLSHCII